MREGRRCCVQKGFFMTSPDFMTVASLVKMISVIVLQVIFPIVIVFKDSWRMLSALSTA